MVWTPEREPVEELLGVLVRDILRALLRRS